jgi:hypothetical protein
MVPPNGWYGYRLPSTVGDARVWYPVNRRGGRHMLRIGAAATVLGAIGLAWWGDDTVQGWLVWIVLAWTMAGMMYSAVVCFGLARQLARDLAARDGAVESAAR